MNTITKSDINVLVTDTALPVKVMLENVADISAFFAWYRSNEDFFLTKLQTKGAILFRGIPIHTMDDFQSLVSLLMPETTDYIDGNSPRTKLSSKVYTSTEYDSTQHITMHNELSYSANYPERLFFCCLIPPATGGETPIADSREIFRIMDPDLVDEIKRKKITYVRNLHQGQGLGPSWQDTFETKDRGTAEKYCRDRGIDFRWTSAGMKLLQTQPGVIQHPVTNEWVWFNQIDQFHPSHLGKEIYQMMMTLCGGSEAELPTFVKFGDNTTIGSDLVAEIRSTIERTVVANPWHAGDLLMVDNVLVAHGRRPFTGKRQVIVSMG